MPPIEIYTSPWCGYCRAAKALLQRKGAPFTEIDIAADDARREEMLGRSNGRYAVPQIFIGATHVGGFDDLNALDKAGKLDQLLSP
ncbi:MAG: glutaredoxin 3 [Variibacter sp.]